MKYAYRNAAGRICCSGDGPKEYLCEDCRRQRDQGSNGRFSATSQVLRTDAEWNAHFAEMLGVGSLVLAPPPDGYAAGLRALGAPSPWTSSADSTYEPYGNPPDGYAIALGR